jgi:hypothetical protein
MGFKHGAKGLVVHLVDSLLDRGGLDEPIVDKQHEGRLLLTPVRVGDQAVDFDAFLLVLDTQRQ